jgi:hypothetical protein
LIGVNDGTNDCIFVTDGSALKKITSAGSSTTISQAGTPSTIYSLTTNGTSYYFINGTHVHKGSVGATPADTEIYNATITRATIRYVKQRLIAAIGASIYELDATRTSSSALPTALFTHPNANWVWSSISEGPSAIYISGYDPNGTSSSVFRIQLDVTTANSLGFPTLETPTVIIDLPSGERINDFDVYLGTYAVLATSKGFRVGLAIQGTGNIQYGPLLFKDAACTAIAFKDSYAYIATLVDGEAGIVRTDLSTTVIANDLYFPWAWDIVAAGTSATASQVAFFGNSDRLAFSTGNTIYAESTTSLVATGYLRTGYIRYNTLETKIYKLLQARIDTTNGGISIQSIDSTDTEYSIGVFSEGETVPEINVNYPTTSQEYLGFKFTISRSTTDPAKGPLFTGYQLKSLPAVPRQRLIQYPVFCYDHESDKFSNEVGYEGSAYARMSQLEQIENVGDTIRVQDFRTGESYLGIIEEMDFINKTPEDKRFSGFGGTLLVTIRTV